jgi:predicted Rossmann fold flavoprotein
VADGKRLVAALLSGELPRRLVDALLICAGVPPGRRAAELSKIERGALVAQLKRCEIRVTGSRGFDKAEVTAGGVALDEVDSRTMESKLVPNLFLAGEILDLDGFIGGYNFQAAFSTGWLAGASV